MKHSIWKNKRRNRRRKRVRKKILGTPDRPRLAVFRSNRNIYAQIIDDLAGRKCAASLDIPVRGILGIVLTAKQRGAIPQARPVIEDMMGAGLYLARKVVEAALRRVGE